MTHVSTGQPPTKKSNLHVPKWRRACYKIARWVVVPVAAALFVSCNKPPAPKPHSRTGNHYFRRDLLFEKAKDAQRKLRHELSAFIEHTAMVLDDVKKFFPHKVYAVLNNLEAFHRIGKMLINSELGKKFLAGKTELTFLYPGSGTHLSPVELAMKLADGSPELKKIKFIYTEIDPDSFFSISDYFKTVVDQVEPLDGFVQETRFEGDPKTTEKPPAEKTMAVEYTTKDGRKVVIEILFAFKMSGEDYYKSEYFAQADAFISHDGTSEGANSHKTILKMFMHSLGSEIGGRDRILLAEYDFQDFGSGGIVALGAFGGISLVSVPYGCGENHPDVNSQKPDATKHPEFTNVAIVRFDAAIVKALKDVSEEALDAYASLLISAEPSGLWQLEGDAPWVKELKPKVLENFKAILPVLGTEDEAIRRNFSISLMVLLSRGFVLETVEDESTAKYWGIAAKDYLDTFTKARFGDALFTTLHGYDERDQSTAVAALHYSNIFLAAFIAGNKTKDQELLGKLRQKVNAEIYSLMGAELSEWLEGLLSAQNNPKLMSDPSIFTLEVERDGLFVPVNTWKQLRDFQLDKANDAIAAFATVLYVGTELQCPAVREFRDYLVRSEFENPYTKLLLRILGYDST